MSNLLTSRFGGAWTLVCALSATAAVASRTQVNDTPYLLPPFEHYQPILDRMPFGAAPVVTAHVSAEEAATAATEAEVKAEQEALARQINMSAVNVTPQGQTAIGFTDRSVNPPSHYYLRVGQSSGGWTVKYADFDDELATLEKDGVEITLKLGEGLVDSSSAVPSPSSGARASALPVAADAPQPVAAGSPRRPFSALPKLGKPDSEPSFADRLRERAVQKTQAEREAESRMREQFERLARETAAREIQRRQEEEALAAEERALLEQQAQ